MSVWYLDSSAAMKLLVEEDESAALEAAIFGVEPSLVSSRLLETELRRAVLRIPGVDHDVVSRVLGTVELADLPGPVFHEAGLLPGVHLRSLDALHLAAAIRLDVDLVVTYDLRMAQSARELGLPVSAPA